MVRKSRRSRNKRRKHRHRGGDGDEAQTPMTANIMREKLEKRLAAAAAAPVEPHSETASEEQLDMPLSWDDFKTETGTQQEKLKENKLTTGDKEKLKKLRDAHSNAQGEDKKAAAKEDLDKYIKELLRYQRGDQMLENKKKINAPIEELKTKYEELINKNNKRWKDEGCKRDKKAEQERLKNNPNHRGYVVNCDEEGLFDKLKAEEKADIDAFILFALDKFQGKKTFNIWNELTPVHFTPPSWKKKHGDALAAAEKEKNDKMHGNPDEDDEGNAIPTTKIPLGGLWEGPIDTGGAERIYNFIESEGASEQSEDKQKAARDRLMRSVAPTAARLKAEAEREAAAADNTGGRRRRTKRRRKSRGGKRRTKRTKRRKSRGGKRRTKRRTKRRRR